MSEDSGIEVEAIEGPCPRCGLIRPGRFESRQPEEIEDEYFWDVVLPRDAVAGRPPGHRDR